MPAPISKNISPPNGAPSSGGGGGGGGGGGPNWANENSTANTNAAIITIRNVLSTLTIVSDF